MDTVGFTITGAAIQQGAQARLAERGYSSALVYIQDALEGLSEAQVQQILSGRGTLSGDSNRGMVLTVDDDWNETDEAIPLPPTVAALKALIQAALGEHPEYIALGKWKVPALPFRAWARKLPLWPEVRCMVIDPEWAAISPPCYRMQGDVPEHTDWLIAADLLDVWGRPSSDPERNVLHGLAYGLAGDIQHNGKVGVPSKEAFTVLCPGQVRGLAYAPSEPSDAISVGTVLVLPNLSADWYPHMVAARAVICEVGGKLAHLAVVGREQGVPIIRIDGACEKFRTGMRVEFI